MIYNVSVAFNVVADTQSEAAQKTADYLSKVAPTIFYQEIEEPIAQPTLSLDDLETVIE
jgi:hypothetical protein